MGGIIAIAVMVIMAGGGWFIYSVGHKAGETDCQTAHAQADATIAQLKQSLKDEQANHITDMIAAEDAGAEQAKTRIIYRQAKGAQDVKDNASVFQNPACVLPPAALQNLNAIRASFRRDAPAPVDGVRDTGNSGGPKPGPAPSPVQVPSAVPGAVAPSPGHNGGAVPTDVTGRHPMGKVRTGP